MLKTLATFDIQYMFARAFNISQGFEKKELVKKKVKELEIDLVLMFVKKNLRARIRIWQFSFRNSFGYVFKACQEY